MAKSRTLLPPLSLAKWMASQEGCSDEQVVDCQKRWVREFHELLERMASGVCDSWPLDDCEYDAYGLRVWTCLEHHWRRLAKDEPVSFRQARDRFESGDLGVSVGQANLLAEVMLAQALEFKQGKAAVLFEDQYMPDVRRIARRAGGERAVDGVDNLLADLILPRESARYGTLPPRIASYQGRTSLRSWLRVVVANRTASEARRKTHSALPADALIAERDAAMATPTCDCEGLLGPVFREAVATLAADDRLLVKMLTLDGVPQQALAKSLGIHSGNITRRRQRALQRIFEHVASAGHASPARARFEECLQSVLAGENPQLQRALGGLLRTAFDQSAVEEP
jgi:RNA polymerase sigma factor (sigma-70 family)